LPKVPCKAGKRLTDVFRRISLLTFAAAVPD
jgi:hypothetical protein